MFGVSCCPPPPGWEKLVSDARARLRLATVFSISAEYYSERLHGKQPRLAEEINVGAWGGIISIVERGITTPLFAGDFPKLCQDGKGPCACDEDAFVLALRAEHPELTWPLLAGRPPSTLAALDLLEFLHRHASAPIERSYHPHFEHHHLEFDVVRGRKALRDDVNRVLERNGSVYELGGDGLVRRLAPPATEALLRRRLPPSRDRELDVLLERAIGKYTSPDADLRREALEQLWDAFERIKTVLDPDKRRGSAALLAVALSDPCEASLIENEMRTLTQIGNDFRIRHHETSRAAVSSDLADVLFARMYALLFRLHPAVR